MVGSKCITYTVRGQPAGYAVSFSLFFYPLPFSHISPPLLHSLPIWHLYYVTCHCHSSYIVGVLSQRVLTSFSFGSPLIGVHFHLVVIILVSYIYFWISSDSLVEYS